MKALVKKNLFQIRGNIGFLIIVLICLVTSHYNGSPIWMMVMCMLPGYTFVSREMDQFSGWSTAMKALPVTAEDYVNASCITVLIHSAITAVLFLLAFPAGYQFIRWFPCFLLYLPAALMPLYEKFKANRNARYGCNAAAILIAWAGVYLLRTKLTLAFAEPGVLPVLLVNGLGILAMLGARKLTLHMLAKEEQV